MSDNSFSSNWTTVVEDLFLSNELERQPRSCKNSSESLARIAIALNKIHTAKELLSNGELLCELQLLDGQTSNALSTAKQTNRLFEKKVKYDIENKETAVMNLQMDQNENINDKLLCLLSLIVGYKDNNNQTSLNNK